MHGKNYICWWKHTLTSGVAYSHRQGDSALRHNMYLLERAPEIFARRRLRICKTQLLVSDAATILRGPRIGNVTPGSDLWQADPVSRCLAKICPEIEATLTSFPPCHQSDSFGPSQRHRSAPLSGWIICRKTRQLAKRPIGPRVTWWGGPVRGKACGGRANQGPGIEGGICAVFAAVQLFIATWLLISARVQVCQHAGEREREGAATGFNHMHTFCQAAAQWRKVKQMLTFCKTASRCYCQFRSGHIAQQCLNLAPTMFWRYICHLHSHSHSQMEQSCQEQWALQNCEWKFSSEEKTKCLYLTF